tara:strand:+ start:62 stop:895 length:834 start_codon:yes stop_codon:yes gene_type:complete
MSLNNLKDIVKVPFTTNPVFEKFDGPLEFKHDLEMKVQRENEFKELGKKIWFESDLIKEKNYVNKVTSKIKRKMQSETSISEYASYDSIVDWGLNHSNDLVIMHKGKVEACFVACASSWNPGDKMGKTLEELHEPVADSEALRKASEGIWRAMTSGQMFHRYTWGISPLGIYSNHPHWPKPDFNSLTELYFRIEHERTITVDEDTAAFLIEVDVYPLQQLFHLHDEPGGGHNTYRKLIRDSVYSMSDAVLDYKNLKKVKRLLKKSEMVGKYNNANVL